jgi:hypothetical protein
VLWMALLVYQFGSLSLLEPSGPVQACTGISIPCRMLIENMQKGSRILILCYPGGFLVVLSKARLTTRYWMFWPRLEIWPLQD